VADASIIAVAERLKIREVASIDGHFRAVRPRGVDFFTLLPQAPAGTHLRYVRWPAWDRLVLESRPAGVPARR
jgi:hypothetical protein